MPEFWLDTNSLVTPSRGPYRFATVPRFWEFLEEKAKAEVIASSEFVLKELLGSGDELEQWAKRQQDTLFWEAQKPVQDKLGEIADGVNANIRYAQHNVARFLRGADPWLIAHAIVQGGRVVTFEKPEPNSTNPKIPDVAGEFGVKCVNLWDALTELKASF